MMLTARTYPDELKIKDALQLYFSANHFKDGGYQDRYFKLKIGSVFIPVPNTKTRIAAVKIHDIHHVLTEYTTSWQGEVELSAWEIASGCEKYSAAWILNFGSFFIGLFLFPRHLYRAFFRGRKCATNLYFKTEYNEALLNKTVGELREKIDVDSARRNEIRDYIAFTLWTFGISVYYLALMAIAYFAIVAGWKFFFA